MRDPIYPPMRRPAASLSGKVLTPGKQRFASALCAIVTLTASLIAAPKKGSKDRATKEQVSNQENAVIWRAPDNIRSRDLLDGPGGKEHAPRTTFRFLKEDLIGSSPKFDVRDDAGDKWRIKLGVEARPEVAAARLVWAVGYFTRENYFLATLRVEGLPQRLHRGQNLIGPGGTIRNAELKRRTQDEKKAGGWPWRHNRFDGTRELNGLRVMMALINNWDLKDDNNSVYEDENPAGSQKSEKIYVVSDLGASFGTTGLGWSHGRSKGNLEAYRESKFVTKVTPQWVDFSAPSRPALINFFNLPEFISRLRLGWIGKRIPRDDARWIGRLLAQLSPGQIRDCFRAAGYAPEQVEGFAKIVEERIAELNKL